MKDKDKEAFDKWWHLTGYPNARPSETWGAAVEYKQKEIDELEKEKEYLFKKMENTREIYKSSEKLQAKNVKLRECVEFYADRKKWSPVYEGIHKYKTLYKVHRTGSKRARQVLKEIGE